jgi:hypothetical protein
LARDRGEEDELEQFVVGQGVFAAFAQALTQPVSAAMGALVSDSPRLAIYVL